MSGDSIQNPIPEGGGGQTTPKEKSKEECADGQHNPVMTLPTSAINCASESSFRNDMDGLTIICLSFCFVGQKHDLPEAAPCESLNDKGHGHHHKSKPRLYACWLMFVFPRNNFLLAKPLPTISRKMSGMIRAIFGIRKTAAGITKPFRHIRKTFPDIRKWFRQFCKPFLMS
jgi:hypothetical protein